MKALLFLLMVFSSQAGSLPNIKFPTLGGMQFWDDVRIVNGHKIQRHVWTKHYRLLDGGQWRLAWGSLADCERLLPKARKQDKPLVLLIHGMGRSHYSMNILKKKLVEKGLHAESLSYSSMISSRKSFAQNLSEVINTNPAQKIYIVTHSLGGILLRDYIEKYASKKVCGAITLAAPHQGSVIVDFLAKYRLHYLLGPTGRTLTGQSLKGDIVNAPFPIQTVAGTADYVPYLPFGFFLGKNSDGIVKEERTKLKDVRHHQVNASHTFIMNHEKVMELIEEMVDLF